jgi:iron complex outermembrane receptor protein
MAYKMMENCSDIFDALAPVQAQGVCTDNLQPAGTDDPGTALDETVPWHKMDTVFYHDLQIGHELGRQNALLTLGVRNVLDQDPPLSRSNIGVFWYNYDPNQYEPPGRIGYLKIGFKF